MNLFIVVFRDVIISQELMEKIKSAEFVGDTYKLTGSTLLVRSYADNPRTLGESIGISDQGSPPTISDQESTPTIGVVLRSNGSYFGYHSKELWDWLAEGRR